MNKVTSIQVGGITLVDTLEDACREYLRLINEGIDRTKISISFLDNNGEAQALTIRDDVDDANCPITVVYGSLLGIQDALEYMKEVVGEIWKDV